MPIRHCIIGIVLIIVAGFTLNASQPMTILAGTLPSPGNASVEQWEIAWDDVVDDSLDPMPKIAHLKLSIINGRISGHFQGLVLGQEREAIVTGEMLESAESPLLLLQQHEKAYTCAYALQKRPSEKWHGAWCDTRGRRGDVVLRKLEASPSTRE